jgi:2-oxoglutarate dehydrogenase E1 component
MKVCVDTLLEHGARKCVFGMPHRGRLNMLANVVRKPAETIFAEFQGVMPTADKEANGQENSGDVKYHLGCNHTRYYEDGKSMTVEILANPSHLECVNPVVMGKVRAE